MQSALQYWLFKSSQLEPAGIEPQYKCSENVQNNKDETWLRPPALVTETIL